jgi:hypothetical protein
MCTRLPLWLNSEVLGIVVIIHQTTNSVVRGAPDRPDNYFNGREQRLADAPSLVPIS